MRAVFQLYAAVAGICNHFTKKNEHLYKTRVTFYYFLFYKFNNILVCNPQSYSELVNSGKHGG